jgi:hypothetical protein
MAGLALLPAACKRDAAIPSERENARLDGASNLLDQAPGELANVDERLPDSAGNESGPPAEANGPPEARDREPSGAGR